MSIIGRDNLSLKVESFRKIKTCAKSGAQPFSSQINSNSSHSETVFVKYQIKVSFGAIVYRLEKRYSEIHKFHGNLRRQLELLKLPEGSDPAVRALKKAVVDVAFPKKTIFSSTSEDFLKARKQQLDQYFKFLNLLFGQINDEFRQTISDNEKVPFSNSCASSEEHTNTTERGRDSHESFDICEAEEDSSFESVDEVSLDSCTTADDEAFHPVKPFFASLENSPANFKVKQKILAIYSNFLTFKICEVNNILVHLARRLLRDSSASFQLSLLEIYSLDFFICQRHRLTLISDRSIAKIIDHLKEFCTDLEVTVNTETNFVDTITQPITLPFKKFLSSSTSASISNSNQPKSNNLQSLIFSSVPIYVLEDFDANLAELSKTVEKLIYTNSPDLVCPGQILASSIYNICNSLSSKNQIYSHLISKSEFVWSNLQHLDLSNNQIRYVDSSVFYLARNLIYLDLSGNQLSEISLTTFSLDQNLPLQHLDLSNNRQLKRLPNLYNVACLEKLILSGTFIDELSFLTSKLPKLGYLDVSNCQLSEYQMVESLKLLPKLTQVNFLGNSICNNHDYRCRILSYCNRGKEPEAYTNFVLDGKLISKNEVLTAEVIAAMDDFQET